ncbi:peptidase C15 [Prochlorothrix hollandica]|uniref:pyroglutamyl-peptidase I family protein n=1 Tax=Prochlorothrix hollandica TaxID=1223 RepID=UPI00333FD414
MKPPSLLLTSFDVWLAHHITNSSDDLLEHLHHTQGLPPQCHLLRRLPVAVAPALAQVQAAILAHRPRWVVCCGMAESRSRLELERQGVRGDRVLHTSLDLPRLSQGLAHTAISDDAGRFVCNDLYFSVLDWLQRDGLATQGLFVHVPPLTAETRSAIVGDFRTVLDRLARGADDGG